LGRELVLGLADTTLVARLLRGGEVGLGLRDRLLELSREAARAGLLLGVGALPVLVLELAHGRLDLAQAILDHAYLVARHLADLVPSALDAGERRARGGAIRGGEQRFGLLEQGELLLEVLAELGVLDGVGLGLRAIEHVARGL